MPKNFDLDSSIKVGVTDIVGKSRGPRSRKEKLQERETKSFVPESMPIKSEEPRSVPKSYTEPEPTQEPSAHEHSVSTHERSTSAQPLLMSTPMSTQNERSFGPPQPSVAVDGLIHQAKERRIALQIRHLHVLGYLKTNLVSENSTRLIYHRQICDVTGIPFASVRRYISDLYNLGIIIARRKAWSNGFQGNYYQLNLVKTRELLGMMESLRYMSSEFNEARPQKNPSERSMSAHYEHSLSTNSSSSNLKIDSTTTDDNHYDLAKLDIDEFPGLDIESLVQFRRNFNSLEAFQNFIDKVAYVVQKGRGTPSEVRSPVGFLIKSLERRFINVDPGYKSRLMRLQEEELRLRQLEVEEMKRVRGENKKLELEKAKILFEEWLSNEAAKRIHEFEAERKRLNATQKGYDVPAQVRAKQILQIQADTFLLETGLPLTMREGLLG